MGHIRVSQYILIVPASTIGIKITIPHTLQNWCTTLKQAYAFFTKDSWVFVALMAEAGHHAFYINTTGKSLYHIWAFIIQLKNTSEQWPCKIHKTHESCTRMQEVVISADELTHQGSGEIHPKILAIYAFSLETHLAKYSATQVLQILLHWNRQLSRKV